MKNYSGIIIILLFFVILITVVSYRGDFPLNDDWTYAYSVKHLFETGSMKLCDFETPTVVFQVFWGWLWCKFLGKFSFEILRLSTLSLSLVGAIFFYLLLKKFNYNEKISLLGTFALLFNPLWFVLSYTFMTDVPYLSVSLISVYFYYTGFKSKKESLLFLGSIFASCAYLIRQLGIIIPFSILVYLFLNRTLSFRKMILICLLPVLTLISHLYWLNYVHGLTWAYHTGRAIKITFTQIYPRLISSMFYIGLFLLPFSFGVWFSPKDKKQSLSIPKQLVIIIILIVLFVFSLSHGWFPYLGNVIHQHGLGTITVAGVLNKPHGIMASPWFWGFITILGALSFTSLVYSLLKEFRVVGKIGLFLFVYIGQFIFPLLFFRFFDRYLLILLPPGIILFVGLLSKRKFYFPVVSLILLVIGIFSFIGTIDYLSWNRAKWEIGKLVIEKGFLPEEIANGFDWDGWFTYQKNMDRLKLQKPVKAIGEWEWQTLNNYKAIVSFSPHSNKGYRILAKTSYDTPFTKMPVGLYAWYLSLQKIK